MVNPKLTKKKKNITNVEIFKAAEDFFADFMTMCKNTDKIYRDNIMERIINLILNFIENLHYSYESLEIKEKINFIIESQKTLSLIEVYLKLLNDYRLKVLNDKTYANFLFQIGEISTQTSLWSENTQKKLKQTT